MYSGIALYNTENIDLKTACELGEFFFTSVGIFITGAGYYKKLEAGDHSGDHDIIEVSFAELKEKIKNNEINAFRIYSECKGVLPWYSSFGYMTSEFSGFSYIDIQYPNESNEVSKSVDLLKSLSERINFPYGIQYENDKVTKTFYYATGDNMVNIYEYENSSLFKKECAGRFKGQERYKNTMLRMVYPINIINNHHLDIKIENINLKEWILSDKKHGSLEQLKNNLWMWKVKYNEIDKVNKYLGLLGILISWKDLSIKKIRKLP